MNKNMRETFYHPFLMIYFCSYFLCDPRCQDQELFYVIPSAKIWIIWLMGKWREERGGDDKTVSDRVINKSWRFPYLTLVYIDVGQL
jgi:hypothetical protein